MIEVTLTEEQIHTLQSALARRLVENMKAAEVETDMATRQAISEFADHIPEILDVLDEAHCNYRLS